MQTFRTHAGFSLIEIMTVVAIIGIMTVLGLASLRGYSRHEETRKYAASIANVLNQARSQAVTDGRTTFVVFSEPTNGTLPFEVGQIATIVTDTDGDGKISFGDGIRPIFGPSGSQSAEISLYGRHGQNALKTAPIPPDDQSKQITDGVMGSLDDGMTLPKDPDFGVPMVVFSSRGTPVTLSAPDDWGAGAGGVYVTDNDQMLLAVLVEPLGAVHTMAWDDASQSWK
ncbi:MAG TPA: prepilin-type N-terminal cleavage/methylation domain-containing protein [Myxococcota bacterium]|nr:prepilin-type N-terminal cleavage/methylation domain-containing protein [Myxococcota bacterium]